MIGTSSNSPTRSGVPRCAPVRPGGAPVHRGAVMEPSSLSIIHFLSTAPVSLTYMYLEGTKRGLFFFLRRENKKDPHSLLLCMSCEKYRGDRGAASVYLPERRISAPRCTGAAVGHRGADDFITWTRSVVLLVRPSTRRFYDYESHLRRVQLQHRAGGRLPARTPGGVKCSKATNTIPTTGST